MEFISVKPKHSRLDQINRTAVSECTSVDAAIAYVHQEGTLIDQCLRQKKCLRLWARLDYTLPIKIDILQTFIKRNSPNFQCKLVVKHFHPKVIWWRDYGIYIGSANLTNAAWFENIEAGIFLNEEEIHEQDLYDELSRFFNIIDECSESLTSEIFEKLRSWEEESQIQKAAYSFERDFASRKILPPIRPILDVTQKSVNSMRKEAFLKEWRSTLEEIRGIGRRISDDDFRPAWVPVDTSPGTQADQFLHFVYENIREGLSYPYMQHFRQNRGNPEKALHRAAEAWKNESIPTGDDSMLSVMGEWSPLLRRMLSQESLLGLSQNDFVEVCKRVHAIRDHSMRISYRSYGLNSRLPHMDGNLRHEYFGKWLYRQKSPNGDSPLTLLYFVLYGGPLHDTADRLFEACNSPKKKISHFGLSSLGELIGWALPDHFPPRNGRTSKALKSLGFSVTVYGEKE